VHGSLTNPIVSPSGLGGGTSGMNGGS